MPQQETQDGATNHNQRTDTSTQVPYSINEKQFLNWETRWETKQDVIDHFLDELERSMAQSHNAEGHILSIVRE